MRKKVTLLQIGIALVFVAVAGCTEAATKIVYRPSEWQDVVIRIDWSKLAKVTSSSLLALNQSKSNEQAFDITHVGSRLVYPKENAAFTQSVRKDSTATTLLTLRVPATDSADLFVVAVHDQDGVRRTLKMGFRRALRILEGSPVSLTLDSLTLVDASWQVADSTVTISNDTIIATGTGSSRAVHVRVRDPYQSGTNQSFTTSIIKFWGTGSNGALIENWRELIIPTTRNTDSVSITKFWPYLDGGQFNLTEAFPIGSEGKIRINWR